jgi:hypothetical protein
MNVDTTIQVIQACIKEHLTPMIWGKHGIGKSDVIKQIGRTLDFDLTVDLRLGQLEVGDLIGMPDKEYFCPACHTSFGLGGNVLTCPVCEEAGKKVQVVGRTIWLPPSWFPQNGESVLLFFDELNRGRLDVQQAAFQIVLDRRIHTHKIPDNCAIVCACNPSGGDYYVQELDPALLDRFVNIKFSPSTKDWFEWARSNAIREEVIDFISTDDRFLGNEIVDIPIEITATPRSYEFLSKVITHLPRQIWGDVAACIIGNTYSISFIESLARSQDKPLKAKQIFNDWKKVKGEVKKQSDEARFDQLRKTCDEILFCLKDGKSKEYTDLQMLNCAEFVSAIPDDLAFSMLKDLANIPDCNQRMLLPKPELFDRLRKAWEVQDS